MFPNPQGALPLPPRPHIEQYKKLAKDLVKVAKARGPAGVREWASEWIANLARLSNLQITPGLPVAIQKWIDDVSEFAAQKLLSDACVPAVSGAQFVIARSHGFMSWPSLVRHIEQLARKNSSVGQFEAAADAIVTGDVQALKQLLHDNPALVRECSTREHRATLLHYTSANGVEGYRQKTPKNIVEITKLLLDSGAEVDAEADVYRGGCTTLGLAATSVHPEVAGVQEPLLQLLLDYGAAIEKPNLAGNQHSAVIACFANGRPRAGAFLAAHGAQLDLESAAGLGRMDRLETFFDSDGGLKPPATKKQLQRGFLWACMYGREDAVTYLADRGADLLDRADSGATPLHWAAGGAHAGIVKLLVDRGAPLEEINAWGGTVLEHAGYGFAHHQDSTDYAPAFELLLAAGAKIQGTWLAWLERLKGHSAEEKESIAAIFRRYGATT
jgi:Ankyrin repeats (many copies)